MIVLPLKMIIGGRLYLDAPVHLIEVLEQSNAIGLTTILLHFHLARTSASGVVKCITYYHLR